MKQQKFPTTDIGRYLSWRGSFCMWIYLTVTVMLSIYDNLTILSAFCFANADNSGYVICSFIVLLDASAFLYFKILLIIPKADERKRPLVNNNPIFRYSCVFPLTQSYQNLKNDSMLGKNQYNTQMVKPNDPYHLLCQQRIHP